MKCIVLFALFVSAQSGTPCCQCCHPSPTCDAGDLCDKNDGGLAMCNADAQNNFALFFPECASSSVTLSAASKDYWSQPVSHGEGFLLVCLFAGASAMFAGLMYYQRRSISTVVEEPLLA